MYYVLHGLQVAIEARRGCWVPGNIIKDGFEPSVVGARNRTGSYEEQVFLTPEKSLQDQNTTLFFCEVI